MTQTSTPVGGRGSGSAPGSLIRRLISRISRLEIIVGALIAGVMLLLVVIEPNILEAPFQNGWTLLFTLGGTAVAAIAFAAMLWFGVPPKVRVIVLVVPFVIVNWWLISPYFRDEVVDEGFSTSISEQQLDSGDQDSGDPAASAAEVEEQSASGTAPSPIDPGPSVEPGQEEQGAVSSEPAGGESAAENQSSSPPPASGPVLLGSGRFVGLAGHEGTGDAAIFQNADGSLVLRFENFDIENGPDLEVYLVPGPDQTSLPEGSIHLGALKGNIGDQNYDLPAGTELVADAYTALVWCEAFSVEFVGATIDI